MRTRRAPAIAKARGIRRYAGVQTLAATYVKNNSVFKTRKIQIIRRTKEGKKVKHRKR